MRILAAACVMIGCSSSHGGAPTNDANGANDAPNARDASGTRDGAAPGDAANGVTMVRVHYPVAGHALTIRGSSGGLTWDTGATMTGSGDTFAYTFTDLPATIEWKPLLDDATWARGPNYHVAPGQTLDIWPHFTSTAGQVVTQIADFHSTTLGNDRPIYAYLPASYGENTDATYPVVYMHDGQNLWAALPQLAYATPWNVDTAFDTAAEHGACSGTGSDGIAGWGAQPLGGAPTECTGDGDCASGHCATFPEAIVIGVANTSARIYEYTPTTDPSYPSGGGADMYLTMLVSELKPAIDAQLRTRPDAASTAMVGSSLGGLVTAYAGIGHADVFSRLGELSPSTWWNNDVIVGDVAASPGSPRPAVVYVDSGQGSDDDEADTDMLAQTYVTLGYTAANFRHVVQPGAEHDETYWAERLPGALQLLLGAR